MHIMPGPFKLPQSRSRPVDMEGTAYMLWLITLQGWMPPHVFAETHSVMRWAVGHFVWFRLEAGTVLAPA